MDTLSLPNSSFPLSPQPQTNSTKNSSAITSPKGTLPPAALVLNSSAPGPSHTHCQRGPVRWGPTQPGLSLTEHTYPHQSHTCRGQ